MMGTLCVVVQGTTPGAVMCRDRSVNMIGMMCGMRFKQGTDT